jgi:sigma-B regulation protein RsbU (phosphoserine phosphatase)
VLRSRPEENLNASPPSRKALIRSWLRRLFQLEQFLVFVGVVVYVISVTLHQHPPLGVILGCTLLIGNLMILYAWAGARIYQARPFPWNWVLFFPIQGGLAFACAAGSIFILQWTKTDLQPFWIIFNQLGYMIIVVCMVSGIVMFGVGEVQRKLKEKNQILEQKVEKGTVALQRQEEELNRAREIQQMLLPNTLPQLPSVQVAGAWQPAKAVGGDYFDVLRLDQNRLAICIGDVAGKGITAALLMANLQASFRAFATPDASPASVCSKLNTFLCSNVAAGKFVTFFSAVLDAEKRTLTYENAGHCPGLLLRINGAVESLVGGGAVLGVLPDWTYKDFSVGLNPGDRLLLFTDGITEAENTQLEEFGESRLLEAARAPHESALDIQRKIMQHVSSFCAGNFRDDATLIVVAIE